MTIDSKDFMKMAKRLDGMKLQFIMDMFYIMDFDDMDMACNDIDDGRHYIYWLWNDNKEIKVEFDVLEHDECHNFTSCDIEDESD